MEQILKATQLSKYFYQKKALDKVDMNIEKGKIYGLLGPNGGGKNSMRKNVPTVTWLYPIPATWPA